MATQYDMETDRLVEGEIAYAIKNKLFSDGIVNEISDDIVLNYLSNHDDHIKELVSLATYYYISNGAVHNLFELSTILPVLTNYRLDVIDRTGKNYERNRATCLKVLNDVQHTILTRDIISQLISQGTFVGMWLGDKKNGFYYYTFDCLGFVQPSHLLNGKWVAHLDMAWFDVMIEEHRKATLDTLSPFVTHEMYNNYVANKEDKAKRYIILPEDRTAVIRTHTLKRTQRFGISWLTQGLYNINHKKKLKDLEKAVANRVINALSILYIGSKEDPETKNLKLNKNMKKKIHEAVKNAMEKVSKGEGSVVGLPEFAELKLPEIQGLEALSGDKYKSVDSDIASDFGISRTMTSGDGGNFASAKINYDIFYKKTAPLIENIEYEVYGKLFNLMLPEKQKGNFMLRYSKEAPLSQEKRLDYLMKLHSEGFSPKPIIDSLDGVSYDNYIEQTIYEREVLKLHEKVVPYQTSYTQSDNGTKESTENPENDNTSKSKTNDGNSLPDS